MVSRTGAVLGVQAGTHELKILLVVLLYLWEVGVEGASEISQINPLLLVYLYLCRIYLPNLFCKHQW